MKVIFRRGHQKINLDNLILDELFYVIYYLESQIWNCYEYQDRQFNWSDSSSNNRNQNNNTIKYRHYRYSDSYWKTSSALSKGIQYARLSDQTCFFLIIREKNSFPCQTNLYLSNDFFIMSKSFSFYKSMKVDFQHPNQIPDLRQRIAKVCWKSGESLCQQASSAKCAGWKYANYRS